LGTYKKRICERLTLDGKEKKRGLQNRLPNQGLVMTKKSIEEKKLSPSTKSGQREWEERETKKRSSATESQVAGSTRNMVNGHGLETGKRPPQRKIEEEKRGNRLGAKNEKETKKELFIKRRGLAKTEGKSLSGIRTEPKWVTDEVSELNINAFRTGEGDANIRTRRGRGWE